MRLVALDIERSGLQGELEPPTVRLGMYPHGVDTRWHHDNLSVLGVRWTLAYGVGSTEAAIGKVAQSDLYGSNVDTDTLIGAGPGSQLRRMTFRQGTVVRIRTTGDIHHSPEGNQLQPMPRLFVRTTLYLR